MTEREDFVAAQTWRELGTADSRLGSPVHQCLTDADIELPQTLFYGNLTHPPASPMSQIRHQGGDRQWA